MQVKPVASPHQIASTTPYPTDTSKAARAKAISMIQGDKPQQPEGHSVNPNSISPEELSAVKPQSQSEGNNSPEVEAQEVKPQPKQETEQERQFKQLAAQEKQLRAKLRQVEQQRQQERQEAEKQKSELQAQTQRYNEGYISKDQLREETLKILSEAGIDSTKLYNDLTEQQLNPLDPRVDNTMSALRAEIKSLKSAIEEGKQQQSTQQQQAYQAALNQIRQDVRSTVANDPNFETIKATRSINDVVELIEQTYNKDGILMSVDEACNEVENYLVEEATKLTRIGKIKRQLESRQTGEMKTQPQTEKTPNTMKTLTNAAASTRKLSSKERAILAFKGESVR